MFKTSEQLTSIFGSSSTTNDFTKHCNLAKFDFGTSFKCVGVNNQKSETVTEHQTESFSKTKNFSSKKKKLSSSHTNKFSQENQKLFESIKNNEVEQVRKYLKAGIHPFVENHKGHTGLYLSSKCANLNLTKIFLSYETRNTINGKRSFESFLVAVRKSNLQIIELFLLNHLNPNQKTCDGDTALHIATKAGNLQVAFLLIEYGSYLSSLDQEKRTPLMIAAKYGRSEILQLYLNNQIDLERKDKQGRNALYFACESGNVKIAQELILAGARLNTKSDKGNFPLYLAAHQGNNVLAQLLLSSGAYVDQTYDGWTPLLIACQNGSLQTVETLLDHNADLHYCDPKDGFSAVFIAIENKHVDVFVELFNRKADLQSVNFYSETPIHIACQVGDLEIIQIMIQNNVDFNIKDENEMTPLMVAAENDHEEVVKLLLDNGAQIDENNEFQIIDIESFSIQKLLKSYEQICFDFLQLFNRQEFCNYFLNTNYNEKIGFHKEMLICRLVNDSNTDNNNCKCNTSRSWSNNSNNNTSNNTDTNTNTNTTPNKDDDVGFNELLKTLKCFKIKQLKHFLSWVYSGLIQNNEQKNSIKEISKLLKLNWKSKTGKVSFVNDLKKIYNMNDSKDFALKLKNNSVVKAHKFVLAARSEMFRGLFLSVKEIKQVTDQTKKSQQALSALIHYFYSDQLPLNLSENILDQLFDAVDYYQLSTDSSLLYLIEN
ncbi:no mechanoreceptor potential c isoform d-related [Anaeramoeba flamelloides]|uniref:No mechanoreceptor potential c isoform d-related n=1 Tax=Anaeramoeba flamelloides TaxID=1746091 RepID=A0AAV7ZDI3_9EUKA|nr:no mechanoreceptor potential c isoform d-related [Anaeramoeba flamelloides]